MIEQPHAYRHAELAEPYWRRLPGSLPADGQQWWRERPGRPMPEIVPAAP